MTTTKINLVNGESTSITLTYAPSKRWPGASYDVTDADGKGLGVVRYSPFNALYESVSFSPSGHARVREFASKQRAIESLVPGSLMTTPRWASCSQSEFGEDGRMAHLVSRIGVTTLCGVTATEPDIWRTDSRKSKCPACVASLARER